MCHMLSLNLSYATLAERSDPSVGGGPWCMICLISCNRIGTVIRLLVTAFADICCMHYKCWVDSHCHCLCSCWLERGIKELAWAIRALLPDENCQGGEDVALLGSHETVWRRTGSQTYNLCTSSTSCASLVMRSACAGRLACKRRNSTIAGLPCLPQVFGLMRANAVLVK